MCILGVNTEAVRSGIRVKSKGTEDGFAMNVKHGTCIFKQKTDVCKRIVHLHKPQNYVDIIKKRATVASESKESFKGTGWGEVLTG